MTTDPAVEAYLARITAEGPAMEAAWAALPIEWHCPGRHGVVRDVPRSKAAEVQRVIDWYMGGGSCRWTGDASHAVRSVEFVAMSKVSPPPRRPWEWCGTTVLFNDWRDAEREVEVARAAFRPGQRVCFEHKGRRIEGIVSHINRKTVAVVVEGEGRWSVPPTRLADNTR